MPDPFLNMSIFWPLKHPLARNSPIQLHVVLGGRGGAHKKALKKTKTKNQLLLNVLKLFPENYTGCFLVLIILELMNNCSLIAFLRSWMMLQPIPLSHLFSKMKYFTLFNFSSDRTPSVYLISLHALISNYNIFLKSW